MSNTNPPAPLIPVLLAGGSGTRLWPLSREAYPKQFLKLVDDWSLLQHTVRRSQALPNAAAPIIICNEQHRFLVAEQLRQCGVAKGEIVLEPEGRNTAPAAAVACLLAQQRAGADALVAEQLRQCGVAKGEIVLEPEGRNTAPAAAVACLLAQQRSGADALVFIMAADHAIADEAAFGRAVQAAADAARQDFLTVFGVKPSRAETGYGYIEEGAALEGEARQVAAFVEKPDRARAEGYVAAGRYFWNSGMFLFRAAAFLDELRALEPAMLDACERSLALAKRDLDFVRLDAAAFRAARADSIDYAVMEKTRRAAMVRLDAAWDDIGSWSFLETLPRDAAGNYIHGDVLLEDSANTLAHSEHRLVAGLGLRDLVVVETKDAVLVADKQRVQDVKRLVARLKATGRSEAATHALVHRPWGSYETIASGPRFQVKHIVVKPGQKLSLQYHNHRAEHWVVVCGSALVTCGDETFTLQENQSTYIPLGAKHRLENPGQEPLELIEVQSGSYLGEDDIVRLTDVYGRAAQ